MRGRRVGIQQVGWCGRLMLALCLGPVSRKSGAAVLAHFGVAHKFWGGRKVGGCLWDMAHM